MTILKIVVQYPAGMPTSTHLRRFHKAVEQFYYAGLFGSAQNYRGKTEPWKSWLKAGFHIGSMGHPPGAAAADYINIDMNPDDHSAEYHVSSANRPALDRLRDLLQAIDKLRPSLQKKDEQARVLALRVNDAIDRQLIKPLAGCLESAGVDAQGISAYRAMTDRGLEALTHGEVAKVEFSLA